MNDGTEQRIQGQAGFGSIDKKTTKAFEESVKKERPNCDGSAAVAGDEDEEPFDSGVGDHRARYRCEFWTDSDHGIYSSTDISQILDKCLQRIFSDSVQHDK